MSRCRFDTQLGTDHRRPAAQVDSLELRIAETPFRVQHVSAKQYGNGATWGEVQLARGADGAAELARLTTWMRRKPGVAAAGRDSQALAR